MSDLGTRIRHLVDETAPPIDAATIVQQAGRRAVRPRWAIGVVAGLGVLAAGFVTFAVFGWGPGNEPAVGPGPGTTQATVATVEVSPSTTSAAQAEAEARAQMEARRKAAEEAAKHAGS